MLFTTLIVAAVLCLWIQAFGALIIITSIIAVLLFPTPLVVLGAIGVIVLTSAFNQSNQ